MKIGTNCLAVALATALSPAVAQAQNLFVSDSGSGNIYEFTPGGVQSTFASGLSGPTGLAFDSVGNLLVSAGNNVYELTPNGARSTLNYGFSSLKAWPLTARVICVRPISAVAISINSHRVERAAPLPLGWSRLLA